MHFVLNLQVNGSVIGLKPRIHISLYYIALLIAESQNPSNQFLGNKIPVNRKKFNSIIIEKSNQTIKPDKLLIGSDVDDFCIS